MYKMDFKNKIAILTNSFPPIPGGGIESANYNLYRMLIENGYDVRVYTYLDHKLDKNYVESDPRIYRFGASKFKLSIDSYWSIVKRKFDKWIFRKDLFSGLAYQYGLVKLSNYALPAINKELKKFQPKIVILPDFGAPGYSLIKLPGTKYIHVSHHNPIRFLYNPLLLDNSEDDALKAIAYEQESLKKIDLVICPSNYQRDVFKKTFVYNKDIVVIPNIIDESFIGKVSKSDIHVILGIDSSYPIVYIPSAASKVKGEKYIVEIVRRLSAGLDNKVGFYLSGGISKEQRFEFDTLNMFHILAPGIVDNETNISYVKDCAICVSPTLVENFGMALLEALFCNLSCVTFEVGGNSDVVVDGVNGFLVPYLNIDILVEKAIYLLKNEMIRINMIENIKNMNDNFSAKNVFHKYLDLFE